MRNTIMGRESFQLFIGMIGTLLLLSLLNSQAHASIKGASFKPVKCETAFGEKSFTIENATIAFHKEKESGRMISSVMGAQTRRTHQGFRKTLYVNGNKHVINIENIKNLNDMDDFMAVTSPKGHKMTYPLTCSLVR